MKTTKKDKIIALFDSVEWHQRPTGEFAKIITSADFKQVGLYGVIENSRQHCDVIYARKIIQSMGHKVLIGMGFHILKNEYKKSNNS